MNECNSGTQTIQVAWNGGVTPYITGDNESDLFHYYIGYSDSSGVLIPHVPISIADIDDNDNFHQLCFSTNDEIVKISMMANTVEDQTMTQIYSAKLTVSSCTPLTILKRTYSKKDIKFTESVLRWNFHWESAGNEYFIIYDLLGQNIIEGKCLDTIKIPEVNSGYTIWPY